MSNYTSSGGQTRAASFMALGDGGSGYVELPSQSSMSSAAAGSVRMFANNNGDFSIIDDAVASIAFSLAGITMSRVYTTPDADGALVGATAAQTLSNKTILAADGNTVDATMIAGADVTGTPSASQYLRFDGANWSPQTISGTSPLSFDGSTMSINVGSVGGVTSFTDPRLNSPQVINVRNGTAGYGEFTSVATAIASITDASTSKRYVIYVDAGVFYEPAWTTKPFVYIQGVSMTGTVIRPNASGLTFVTATSNTSITSCMLFGDGTGTGLLVDSCQTSIFNEIVIMNFATLNRYAASTGLNDTSLVNFLYFAPFQYGIVVDGTVASSVTTCNTAFTLGRIRGDASSINAYKFVGPYARVTCNAARATLCSTGTALYIDDGASVDYANGKATNCAEGVNIANVGAGPTVYIRDSMWVTNTHDITVSHTAAIGLVSGVADRTKVTVDPAALIVMAYTDISATPANIITGEFVYSPANDTVLTETGSLLVYGSPVGCYDGGAVTAGVGLNVSVAAGSGYIQAVASKVYVRKITWSLTSVAVTDDATTYVYANETGVIAGSSVPDLYINVLLARIVASSGAIEFIDTQTQSNYHPATREFIMDRAVEIPLFATGCIASVGGGNTIDVTSGVYYYLNNKFEPAGGSGVSMRSYYRNGSGGWTIGTITALTASYDAGGGVLAAVTPGNYARYVIYVVDASTFLVLYGQALFPTELQAASDPTTVAPTQFIDGVAPIATVTVDSAGTLNARDVRNTGSPGGAGVVATVTNHGSLSGLAQDDHLQYLLCNGSRAMSGALNMGTYAISNAGTYNGVSVQAHASRHLPNGADPLTTAAPIATITSSSVNAVGTANSFARSDHSHALDVSGYNINSFNGSLSVGNGGTGTTLLTAGRVLIGNGPSSVNLAKPAPTGSFVGTTDAQVLSNKDLAGSTTRFLNAAADGVLNILPGVGAFTGNWAVSLANNYTLTFPAITDTVTTATGTQTFSNKTIQGGANGNNVYANFIYNPSNPVILPATAPTGTGQVLVIAGVPNAVWGNINSIAGTLSVPNGGTGRTTLTAGSVLVGNGISAVDVSKAAPAGAFVGTTDVQTLSSKTLAAATTLIEASSGNSVAFSPTGVTSIVTAGAATITLPSGTRTLVARDTTDTLTNKTITDASNSVAASFIRYSGGSVATSAASVPTAGQVLTAINATTAAWQNPVAGVTFPDNTWAVTDAVDTTKTVKFDVAGTTGTSTTLVTGQTADISIVLPTASDTLVGRATTDTLTNKTLTAPVIATIVNGGTLTLPTATDTLVGRATTDTLSNKTLAAASTLIAGSGNIAFTAGGTSTTTLAAAPSAPNTLTLPTSTDTLVGRATTDTLSNKIMTMVSTSIVDGSTRSYLFSATGTASTSLTISSALTASRVIVIPDISDTLVSKTSTDVLSNKSVTGGTSGNTVSANLVRAVLVSNVAPTAGQTLVATTTTDAAWATPSVSSVTGTLPVTNGGTGVATLTSGGVLVGAGTGAVDTTKAAPAGAFVGTTDTQTLSGKTLTAPVIATIVNGGTLTLPSSTDTLVGRATTDTLTNKTLTAPVIGTIVNTGTLTLPTATDTLVGRATTDTLTNKTAVSATNTIAAKQLHNATGTVDVSASAAPTAGQTLVATDGVTAAWATPSVATVTGTLAVANGGTGATTLTSGNVLVGAGTSAVTTTKAAPIGAFVGTTDTQTLSGKTLTAPVIATIVNTGTLTLPSSTDTLVGRDTTDTLTNKTIVSTTNTVAAQQLFTATGVVSVSASAAPTAGQTLVATNGVTAAWATPSVSAVTGTLPVANGGTGTTTLTSGNVLVGAGTGAVTTTKAAPAGVFVGTTDAQTLTNKVINDATNTVSANLINAVTVSGTAPTAGQVLQASSGTAASWANISAPPGGFMSSSSTITATTTTATNVSGNGSASAIAFPGSIVANIVAFSIVASKNNNAASYTVQLQDITNALTIASVTVNVTASTIYTTTTISNVPAGPAILQVQALKIGAGTTTLTMQGWTMRFG